MIALLLTLQKWIVLPTDLDSTVLWDGEICEGGTVLVIDARYHTYSIDMLVFLQKTVKWIVTMPLGTCFDLNTTLMSEYDGQNEIRYADLKGIPTRHTFTRSTWAIEDFRGLALVCEMGVPHRYDAKPLSDCDAAFCSCDVFLFSLPAAVLLNVVVLFPRDFWHTVRTSSQKH